MTRLLVTLLFVFLMVPASARGERLPIKAYTTADGLAHNVVNRIVRDSRGFLWFCTREGLSRFDGYGFSTYRLADGLPSDRITDLIETREGLFWIATDNGLVRFDPRGISQRSATPDDQSPAGAMFTTYAIPEDARASTVTALLVDRSGAVWVGTEKGLYRLDGAQPDAGLVWIELGIPDVLDAQVITALTADPAGHLWIGTTSGLYRRAPDGRVEQYTVADGLPDNFIQVLRIDGEGRFWAGTRSGGVCRLTLDPRTHRAVVTRVYGKADGLPVLWINDLFQDSRGTLWLGTTLGLVRFVPTLGGDGRFDLYAGERHGLEYTEVRSIAEDTSGNLWMGTEHGGASRVWMRGFTTFNEADGLSRFLALARRRSGELAVISHPRSDDWVVFGIRQARFERIATPQMATPSWGWHQQFLEDRDGDWWFATREGVVRFPPVMSAPTRPKAIYTMRDGLSASVVMRLFEDSRGDVWIATVGEGQHPSGVSRWERTTDTLHHYGDKDGLPSGEHSYPCAFAEDHHGNVWIGFSAEGGLARYRNGTFSYFSAAQGAPPGRIHHLLVDDSGRLWLASTSAGVTRVDAPELDVPMFRTYTTAQGLSSNDIGAIVDDEFGRVYAATAQGIDRIEPTTDRIRHYGAPDGVPLGAMNGAVRDRDGALWFANTNVVRLIPEGDSPPRAPAVLITRLDIAGRTQRISALGEAEIPRIEVGPDPGQIEVDFLALGFEPGERLRYSYILEGAEDEWSALADQRRVTYAGLGSGTYRFRVRAVNADGLGSEVPASFSLTVWPPVWQRWWFVSLTVLATALAAFGGHRYRVSRLLEIAHVRTRIATDLHDDIGANLTRIAVLSEVARQQSGDGDSPTSVPLASIATVARESVASMGDIVWAINPERDRLNDLLRRMRAHAEDVFAHGNVTVTLNAPDASGDAKLGVDVRRDLFLIFKEAINNAARHAVCSAVHIDLHLDRATLVLEVTDDGIGFDPLIDRDGNGLASMRRRARALGGRLDVMSRRDAGTTVRVALSLARSRPRIFGPLHRQVGDRDESRR